MSVVIDASLTIAWHFDDEATAATDSVLDRVSEAGAVVPALWRLEVANAFQAALRRRRITALYRDQSLAALSQMPSASPSPSMMRHTWNWRSAAACRWHARSGPPDGRERPGHDPARSMTMAGDQAHQGLFNVGDVGHGAS